MLGWIERGASSLQSSSMNPSIFGAHPRRVSSPSVLAGSASGNGQSLSESSSMRHWHAPLASDAWIQRPPAHQLVRQVSIGMVYTGAPARFASRASHRATGTTAAVATQRRARVRCARPCRTSLVARPLIPCEGGQATMCGRGRARRAAVLVAPRHSQRAADGKPPIPAAGSGFVRFWLGAGVSLCVSERS